MALTTDVLCIGKTTLDEFLVINDNTQHFRLDPDTGFLSFKHGEKIGVEQVDFCLGGNATNVGVGLSRLGHSTALCTEIGDDEFSLKIRKKLGREKIDLSNLVVAKNSRSPFSVIMNYRGERSIFMQRMQREHHFSFETVMAKYVYLTSLERDWQPTYKQALAYIKNTGTKLAFNPGTIQLHDGRTLILQIIEHTDILFVNKEEAEELVWGHEKRKRKNDTKYLRELLTKLQKMGSKTVVITNGKYGSHSVDEQGNFYHEGLYPAVTLERTGAGDSYSAGFLGAILYGKSVKEAMKWGAINSASVVEQIGAQAGLLSKEEMEKRDLGGRIEHVTPKSKFNPFYKLSLNKLRLR